MANIKNKKSLNNSSSVLENRDNYTPDFNPTIKTLSDNENNSFNANLQKYVEFASWMGW